MASFEWMGKSWLLLADVGDNARRRSSCTVYFCEEPSPEDGVTDARAIEFQYEDGPQDCEAVGYDVERGMVFLATKTLFPHSRIYELPGATLAAGEKRTARHLATVAVPMATAMDVSTDGRLIVIATYGDGFVFARGDGESWRDAFARTPRIVSLPLRRQGESICFSPDGRSLYLTSEQRRSPLWEISRQP
jgi:hypothetical protein